MGPLADNIPPSPDNGWQEYKLLVLGAIKELKAEASDTRKEMTLFRVELAKLGVRMALLMTGLTIVATGVIKYL